MMLSSASSLKDLAASLAQTHGARELTKMAGEGEAYEYVGSSSGLPLYAQTFDLGAGRAGYIAILGDYVDPEETIEVFLSFPADQLGGGVEQLSNVEGNILVANEINGKQKGSYPIKVD